MAAAYTPDPSAARIRSTGATVSRTIADRAADQLNVKDFGAVGDSSHDDTQAFLACLFTAIGSPGAPLAIAGDLDGAIAADAAHARTTGRVGRVVYIPPGLYRITRPIPIWSVSGIHIHGGSYGTILIPAFTTPADGFLDLNGVAFSTFDSFTVDGIAGDQRIGSAVRYYWDQATAARSSSECTFAKVQVFNVRCKVGFEVGLPDSLTQVDTTSYYDVLVTGAWDGSQTDWYQYGYRVGGAYGNNLIHHFYHYAAVGWARGFGIFCTGLALFGGDFGANGSDFYLNALSYVEISALRSELSRRFLDGPAGANNAVGNVSVGDVQWTSPNLAPDGEWFRSSMNGVFHLRNVQVYCNGDPPVDPVFAWTPFRPSVLFAEGITTGNSPQSLLAGCNERVTVKSLAHVQRFADGSPTVCSVDLIRRATSGLSLSAADHTIDADASAGSVPLLLPPAFNCTIGREFVVRNAGATGAPTVAATAGDSIVGPYSLASQWSAVRFVGDGAATWTAQQIGGA